MTPLTLHITFQCNFNICISTGQIVFAQINDNYSPLLYCNFTWVKIAPGKTRSSSIYSKLPLYCFSLWFHRFFQHVDSLHVGACDIKLWGTIEVKQNVDPLPLLLKCISFPGVKPVQTSVTPARGRKPLRWGLQVDIQTAQTSVIDSVHSWVTASQNLYQHSLRVVGNCEKAKHLLWCHWLGCDRSFFLFLF